MQWGHDGIPNASGVVFVIQGWSISVATSMMIDHFVICVTMRCADCRQLYQQDNLTPHLAVCSSVPPLPNSYHGRALHYFR